MRIPPPATPQLGAIRGILAGKKMQEVTEVTDLTNDMKDLGISGVLNSYFKAKPIPDFNENSKPDDYNYYVQIGEFPRDSEMQIWLKQPHVVIYCQKKDNNNIRVISVNPRDRSLGPVLNCTLSEYQYNALKTKLGEHFDIDAHALLRFELLN